MQGGEEWKINNENDYDHVWINGGNNQEILQVKVYINSLNCYEKFHKFSAMCQLKSVPNPWSSIILSISLLCSHRHVHFNFIFQKFAAIVFKKLLAKFS